MVRILLPTPVKEINFPKTLNNLGISSLKNPKCHIINIYIALYSDMTA